ncbi:S49 family peptidase [Paraconexibacter antarcticus]|uniref:S49 family peptidase n=1 Tax=Paraconexibacter antarcticus TaxID=2949664 RepID=A0ABY5DVW6_9ACTN|nr:S49 family peptidase [Paraconexibacter antarcticus]UTI65674.1 S49 family peptidase [Paraconexibacter antarcticus]
MTRAADVVASLPLPPALKERLPAAKPVVAVVKLQGIITATPPPLRGGVSLATTEDALKRAFAIDAARLQAVVLLVNSPGGSPTQSALVADRIRGLAAEHDVPVIACCEDLAASGGYWLACAADEIVVHATSIVGSIGVVTQGFGLDGLIERLGVERRLYTAGESKARLDPFLPEKADDVAWLRGLHGELHELFIGWVKERRGDRLTAGDTNLFEGEVWTGARAVELGLADRLGTLRSVVAERWPDAEITTVDARKPLLARLGVGSAARGGRATDTVRALLDVAEERAAWARYGR